MDELSVKEVARRKGCTLKYVYDLLAAGRLRGARKSGRHWRIPARALESTATPTKAVVENAP